MLYFLIFLSLVLLGVAGLQFSYMFYMDRMDKERKKRLRDLEKHCKILKKRLAVAEGHIREKDKIIESISTEEQMELLRSEDENWDEILEDGNEKKN